MEKPFKCQRCRIITVSLAHDPTYGWLCKECVTQVQIDELKSHCERLEERIEELEADRKFREAEAKKNAIIRPFEEEDE